MRQPASCVAIAMGTLAAGLAAARPVYAQVPLPAAAVRTTISATTSFDDNVLSLPHPTADFVLRVTPGIVVNRGRAGSNWTAAYSFDAERYQNRSELTTAQARQGITFSGTARATRHTSFVWTGSYTSTTNPSELNQVTGLNIGRVRANQWQGGSTVKRTLSPHMGLDLAYAFSRTAVGPTGVTMSNGVDMRLAYRPAARAETYLRVDTRRFDFGAAAGKPTETTSANVGWSMQGQAAHVSAEAGILLTNGTWGPSVDFSLGRKFGLSDLTGSYARSITTAVGIGGAVSFDRVQLNLTHRARATGPQGGLQVGARISGTRNTVLARDLFAIQYGFDLTAPVARALSLQVGYDGTFQQTTLGVPGLLSGDIRRNRVFFTISLSPWSAR